jgi:hypothetical protein
MRVSGCGEKASGGDILVGIRRVANRMPTSDEGDTKPVLRGPPPSESWNV